MSALMTARLEASSLTNGGGKLCVYPYNCRGAARVGKEATGQRQAKGY